MNPAQSSARRAHTIPILGNTESSPADQLHTSTIGLHGDPYLHELSHPKLDVSAVLTYLRNLARTNNSTEILHPLDGTRTSIDQLLEATTNFFPTNWSLVELDRFRHEHPTTSRCLVTALLHLPPKEVAEITGIVGLVWTVANLDHEWGVNLKIWEHDICHKLSNSKNKLEQFFKKEDFDVELLEKAQRAVLHWVHPDAPNRAQTMMMNYNLLRSHTDANLQQYCNINELIASGKFTVRAEDADVKRGIFPLSRSLDYSVHALLADGKRDYGDTSKSQVVVQELDRGRKKIYHHCIDAPLGFSLRWKGLPQATLSGLITDPHTFFIIQAQGVQPITVNAKGEKLDRSGSRGLVGLRWERLLFAMAEQYCQAYDLSRLGLLGSANNQWLGSERNIERTFKFSHAASVYDSEARQGGFVYDHSTKNHFRDVPRVSL